MHVMYSVTTAADATPPVASLKRQQFASLRCTTSCSSDEGNIIEFTPLAPLAPLARLDSLHEMVRASQHYYYILFNILYIRIRIIIVFIVVGTHRDAVVQ